MRINGGRSDEGRRGDVDLRRGRAVAEAEADGPEYAVGVESHRRIQYLGTAAATVPQ